MLFTLVQIMNIPMSHLSNLKIIYTNTDETSDFLSVTHSQQITMKQKIRYMFKSMNIIKI